MISSRQSRSSDSIACVTSWGRASEFNFETIDRNRNKKSTFILPYFEACLFATILEDTISQLRILGTSPVEPAHLWWEKHGSAIIQMLFKFCDGLFMTEQINLPLRIQKTMSEMTKLLAKKYRVKERPVKDELDDIDLNNLDCMEYKLKKLESDRKLLARILNDTYLDLCLSRNFQELHDTVNNIVEEHNHLDFLIEEESKNKIIRRDLNRQVRQQRNHMKSTTYDINNKIETLKTNLQDAELKSEIRKRYVVGWQLSRTEQHHQAIYDKEIGPMRTIEQFKRRADQEQHVHTEIELLINIKINEVLMKIEEWMAKYDKDIERIDLRIQLKRNEYEVLCEKKLELEEMLEKHAILLNNWVKFKEEREAARKYREKMNEAATVVQAWWRGLLVRNELGPYKVQKKRGAKTQEKSGKKKK